jgi:hypothetical protein
MPYIKKLSLKTKLLIYECKERFPQLSADFIADRFSLDIRSIEKLFNDGEIEIPSKMNKEHGRTKKKIYKRERILPGRGENTLHEGIPGEKRPMLRRTV